MKFKKGDKVKILNTGCFVNRQYSKTDVGNIREIESTEELGKDSYNNYKLTFTTGEYCCNLTDDWSNYLELVEEKIAVFGDFQEVIDYANKYGEYKGSYKIKDRLYYHFPSYESCTSNGSVFKGYKLITKQEFLDRIGMKKIIGYKLKDEFKQYEAAACKIALSTDSTTFPASSEIKFHTSSNCETRLKQAGVLDIWFEPVYEKELKYKVGDYLYCIKDFYMTKSRDLRYRKDNIYLSEFNQCITDEVDNKKHSMPTNMYLTDGSKLSDYFRLATDKEIIAMSTKNMNINGIVVTVSLNKIVADNKVVDVEKLDSLYQFLDSHQFNLPWTTTFSTVHIGCTSFSKNDLEKILVVYDQINKTGYSLPF